MARLDIMSSEAGFGKEFLQRLQLVAFGVAEEVDVFINSLKAFQRVQKKSGASGISLPAIDNWFTEGKGGPQRKPALEFLRDYILWMAAKPDADSTQRKAFDALRLEIASRLYAFELSPPSAATGEADRARLMRDWHLRKDTQERLNALSGVYQVIRPYVGRNDAYVLEVMEITAASAGAPRFKMYSHNQAVAGFAHQGDVYPSSRYTFGFASRPDEEDTDQFTFRGITLNTPHRKLSTGYESRPCLSGIILRGVKGVDAIGLPAVAVPIVAIRAHGEDSDLGAKPMAKVTPTVSRLHAASSILVGEVKADNGDVFSFCERLFSQLRPHIFSGLVLQAVRPGIVERAIAGENSDAKAHFLSWSTAVGVSFKSDVVGQSS